MADITIQLPCDDDDDCGKRGKRGKRGHRGHRGHDGRDGDDGAEGPPGPPGPPGPEGTGSGSLLRFSGVVAPAVEGLSVSFLEDWGVGTGLAGVILTAPSYPVAVAQDFLNMSTNLLGSVVPTASSLLFELVKNLATAPVVVASISYGPTETGIKSVVFGPEPFAFEDTFDIRVTATGIIGAIDVSATVGVE